MNVGQKMNMNNKIRTESQPEGEWISYKIQHAITSLTTVCTVYYPTAECSNNHLQERTSEQLTAEHHLEKQLNDKHVRKLSR